MPKDIEHLSFTPTFDFTHRAMTKINELVDMVNLLKGCIDGLVKAHQEDF